MIERLFCMLLRQGQKYDKKLEIQLFLVRLLVLLTLSNRLCVCLVLEASALGLTVSLAIARVELIGKKIVIG